MTQVLQRREVSWSECSVTPTSTILQSSYFVGSQIP